MTTIFFQLSSLAVIFRIFIALSVLVTGCGLSKKSDDQPDSVAAPVVSGSSKHGLAFSAVPTSSTFRGSTMYYYDFAAGNIRELFTSESDNPFVIALGTKVFFFLRDRTGADFKIIEPKSTSSIPTTLSIADIEEGDPWDVVTLPNDTSKMLLALRETGRLLLAETQTGKVLDMPDIQWETDGEDFRPIGLAKKGSSIFVLHHGLDSQKEANNSQRIFVLKNESAGVLAAEDQDASTVGIDGVKLRASNATKFFHTDESSFLTVGLSASWMGSNTSAAAEVFTPDTRKVSLLADLSDLDYEYKGNMTEGDGETVIYAHVKKKDTEDYAVVKFDFSGGEKRATVIEEVSHSSIFGLFFDKSSGTLFVGGKTEGGARLNLYKNDVKTSTVELSKVPYSGAFVDR